MLKQSESVHYSGIKREGRPALGMMGLILALILAWKIAQTVKGLASLNARVEMRLILKFWGFI